MLLVTSKNAFRYNNNLFMTESFRKEMIRSKLRNEFNKSRTRVNWRNYKKQRNKCVKYKGINV